MSVLSLALRALSPISLWVRDPKKSDKNEVFAFVDTVMNKWSDIGNQEIFKYPQHRLHIKDKCGILSSARYL